MPKKDAPFSVDNQKIKVGDRTYTIEFFMPEKDKKFLQKKGTLQALGWKDGTFGELFQKYMQVLSQMVHIGSQKMRGIKKERQHALSMWGGGNKIGARTVWARVLYNHNNNENDVIVRLKYIGYVAEHGNTDKVMYNRYLRAADDFVNNAPTFNSAERLTDIDIFGVARKQKTKARAPKKQDHQQDKKQEAQPDVTEKSTNIDKDKYLNALALHNDLAGYDVDVPVGKIKQKLKELYDTDDPHWVMAGCENTHNGQENPNIFRRKIGRGYEYLLNIAALLEFGLLFEKPRVVESEKRDAQTDATDIKPAPTVENEQSEIPEKTGEWFDIGELIKYFVLYNFSAPEVIAAFDTFSKTDTNVQKRMPIGSRTPSMCLNVTALESFGALLRKNKTAALKRASRKVQSYETKLTPPLWHTTITNDGDEY